MNGCKLYPGHDACQFKMNITFSRSRIVDWWSHVALIVNQWPSDKMVTTMLLTDLETICVDDDFGQKFWLKMVLLPASLYHDLYYIWQLSSIQYATYSGFTIIVSQFVLRWMFQELDMATMFKLMFHVKTRTLSLSCNHTVTSSRILLFWKMRYCTSTLAC